MNVIETKLPGVMIIEPKVFGDKRGFSLETFQAERYKKEVGIDLPFVQDNCSRSQQDVLRGLHFQVTKPQGKVVSCLAGEVYDVAVDIRPGSSTIGEYVAVELSGENHRQMWIPPGYAHGFCVVSEYADFYYKCTDYYNPSDEGGVQWNDPDISIDWPVNSPRLSEKDQKKPTLKTLIMACEK